MQDVSLPSLPPGTPWWGYLLALLVGGAGLRFAQSWLEGRRLEQSDYRDLLQCHIEKQQRQIEELTEKLDKTQDERISALEQENTALRARVLELEVQVVALEAQLRAR
jgi:predicted RNase H-like nuclease (RuvC/YqgF family)